jgi:hypothetical protein
MKRRHSLGRRLYVSLTIGPRMPGPPGKRSRRPGELEGEPVEPPRPRPLAGGAAAELEFDS